MPERAVLPGPFGGHPGSVLAVAYSPDGKTLASGGSDGTVRLWDPRTGSVLGVLTGHNGPVRSVDFAPDGLTLASGGRDGTVRVADVRTGAWLAILTGHTDAVVSVAFSPDGRRLASAGDDGVVRMWDPVAGVEVGRFSDRSRMVAFSPDGGVLASAGRDGKVRLWDMATGHERVLADGAGWVHAVAFSPDGRRLASAGDDGVVRMWDPVAGVEVGRFSDRSRMVVFSPDSGVLASAGRDGKVRLWDMATGHDRVLADGAGLVHSLAFSPDGERLASAGNDGAIRLIPVADVPGDSGPTLLVGHTCEILLMAYSPNGALVATGDVDGVTRVWETARGTLAAVLDAGDLGWVRSLAFNGEGTLLATVTGARTHVWDVEAGFASRTVLDSAAGVRVTSAVFAGSGPLAGSLTTGDDSGQLTVWNIADGSQLNTSTMPDWLNGSVQLSSDGALAAAVGYSGQLLSLWDLAEGARLPATTDEPESTSIGRVVFHPEGRLLASGGGDGVIRLWNLADMAAPLFSVTGHDRAVRTLAFAPDGSSLASGGDDGAVRLWDTRLGTPIRTLTGHAAAVRCVAYAPDGETLMSAGDDGRILEWSLLTGQLLRGGGQLVRPMPAVPGVRSDEASRVDLLGMADDVRTLATLVAATGTKPPLAIALLGEWGSGKSSVMLQLHDAVEQLAALSRSHPGRSLYAANVLQVRFNAWQYSDDHVWTGLIDHLFRTLASATTTGGDGPPTTPADIGEARDRLRRERDAERTRCDELAAQRDRPVPRPGALWRARRALLTGLVFAGAGVGLAVVGQWLSAAVAAALGVPVAWIANGRQLPRPVGDALSVDVNDEIRQARSRLADLDARLAQVDAAAHLALLLRQHTDTDPYAGSRGVLGQVHRDLEQFGEALHRHREEARLSGLTGEPPLERIVLYIDDLDRCPPGRVVEVLAAIHLMLALPLFVVVAAVDPRWLLGALHHHYRELFAADTDSGERLATPLDYLDKIFQIPFTVRAPSPQDTANYLTTLLGEGPADRPAAVRPPGARPPSARPPGARTSSGPRTGRPDTGAAPATPARPEPHPADGPDPSTDRPVPAASTPDAVPDLRPGGLVLRPDEADFMALLGPLLSTPRAAKKLVNLYRLVRIGIPDPDLPAFVGSDEYKVVQILLAILVGTPQAAPAIFAAILDAPPGTPLTQAIRTSTGPSSPDSARIAHIIGDILPTAGETVTTADAFQPWCPTLSRYSFHTRP